MLMLSLGVAFVTSVRAFERLRFIPVEYSLNAVADLLTSDFQALPPSLFHIE